ncbi:MAG: RNA polymerase sigma-70 factor [Roseibium sp.]
MNRTDKDFFETQRPRLLGLAYRMLGSLADAEDAVQDTFLKWRNGSISGVANPEAFLTTVCTRCCLDHLKAAHRKRVDYVGPWIPEPLQIDAGSDPESDLVRAESLTTAFLLLLERLSPKERAAYLLREVFGKPYGEVAAALGVSEPACRQLVSRAVRHVRDPVSRFVPAPDHQQRMLQAFLGALESGSPDRLAGLLAETVQFQSDGGGKTAALRRVLDGREPVARYVARIVARLWSGGRLKPTGINGLYGLAVMNGSQLVTAMTLGYDADGLIDRVYNIRNPDKLARFARPLRHDPSSGALWQ